MKHSFEISWYNELKEKKNSKNQKKKVHKQGIRCQTSSDTSMETCKQHCGNITAQRRVNVLVLWALQWLGKKIKKQKTAQLVWTDTKTVKVLDESNPTHDTWALCTLCQTQQGLFLLLSFLPSFLSSFLFEAVFVFPSLWVSYFVVVWHQREQSLIFTGKTVQQGVGNKTKSRWAAITSGRLFSLVVVPPPRHAHRHTHTRTRAHTQNCLKA